MAEHNFGPLVAHAPYTMNLCSAKAETVEFARRAMAEDLERMESLPGNYYNFHPGSHVKQGADKGIELIYKGLNQVLVAGQSTRVLLETKLVGLPMILETPNDLQGYADEIALLRGLAAEGDVR